MIGSSSSSTYRRMERKFANEGPSMSSIDSAGTALDVTVQPVRSGTSCVKPITGAHRSRLRGVLQKTDPPCDNPPITPEDAEPITQLKQMLKAPGGLPRPPPRG